jgi:hypothetical protein
MKEKKNELNPEVFEEARKRVESVLPHNNIKKGFFIRDFKGASVLGGMASVAVSAVVNIVGDSLNLRTYRLPKQTGSGLLYKVDETRGINKQKVQVLKGSEIKNHHIHHDVPEDMMQQNNVTLEVVQDGVGGLKPNVGPDGMVKAYVNFPDSTQEMLRKLVEKSQGKQDDRPANS